jgi:RNA polymerase-binding transcription factor DksA
LINSDVVAKNKKSLECELERIDLLLKRGDEARPGDQEYEVVIQNHRHSKEIREDIVLALERIENGVYGLCVRCGNEISEDRLIALPYAGTCIDCRIKEGINLRK